MSSLRTVFSRLFHHRKVDSFHSDQELRRSISIFDLTILGIGSCLGAGIYVVTGELARDIAGPAVVISFFLASAAAFFSGLCYAEYGSRCPTSGSAYSYSYVTLGEFLAFVVGWNMALEYIIAAASLARATSEYINSIVGGGIYRFFMNDIVSWNVPFLGPFPDFLALTLAFLTTVITCLGVKQSSIFNRATTFVNFIVIAFIIFVGLYFVDTSNWSSPIKFAPYGVRGILTASGSAFYAVIGFENIASAGEEAINPRTSLPLSLMLTVAVTFLSYFGVATILTLIISYDKLSRFAPLAEAFVNHGFPAAKYVISIGAICAIACSLQCQMFSAARVVYTMALDGLLFRSLATVNQKTKVPVRAAVCNFFLIGVLALLLDIRQLVEMVSIGTLIAYTAVVVSVLLTRYQPDVTSVSIDDTDANARKLYGKFCCIKKEDGNEETIYEKIQDEDTILSEPETNNDSSCTSSKTEPTSVSYRCAVMATLSLVLGILGINLSMSRGFSALVNKESWAIVLVCVFGLQIILSLMVLVKQPKNSATFPFMVPACPYLPTAALWFNTLLLVNLNYWTYIRFSVWFIIGLLIYGFYGYRHSMEGLRASTISSNENESIITEKPLPLQQSLDLPQTHGKH